VTFIAAGASMGRQEIGLGQAQSILGIEIFWPKTGQTQHLNALAMDHFYKVREGDPTAMPWPLKSFKLPAPLGPDAICAPPLAQKLDGSGVSFR